MLMRQECVAADSIGGGANAFKLLQQIPDLEDADSGYFGGTAGSTAAQRF